MTLTSWKYAVKARASSTAVDVVDLGEQVVQRAVVGLARQTAHPLDEVEQLGPLVPGQRLTEQAAELSDRGAQGGVLLVGGDPCAEGGDVRGAAVGLDELLGGQRRRHGDQSGLRVFRAG